MKIIIPSTKIILNLLGPPIVINHYYNKLNIMSSRRDFVKKTAIVGAGITLAPEFNFWSRN